MYEHLLKVLLSSWIISKSNVDLLYSEVVEYSLSKLLDRLQITHKEVRLKHSFRFMLLGDVKGFNIPVLYFTFSSFVFFYHLSTSLLTCVFCWAVTIVTR